MKQLAPWLLWFAVGCSVELPGEDFEHHPADAGSGDADAGDVHRAMTPPPPIAGGGLEVNLEANRAVVADADRDRVVVVDLAALSVVREHPLRAPGRVVLSGGLAYVTTPGAVVAYDLADGTLFGRVEVCPTPRGLAIEGTTGYVACLGGALLDLDLENLTIRQIRWLPPDLRDVLVVGRRLWVSRLRDAEIIVLDGEQQHRLPRPRRVRGGIEWQGRVGWRLRRMADGRVALLHQWHRESPGPDLYGRPMPSCDDGLVVPALTIFDADVTDRIPAERAALISSHAIGGSALVVDVVATDAWVGLATPGEFDFYDPFRNPAVDDAERPLRWLSLAEIDARPAIACLRVRAGGGGRFRPVAVAAAGELLLYYDRERGLMLVDPRPAAGPDPRVERVPIDGRPVLDDGHAAFHVDPGGGVTCANCHPEGGDDGHVWNLGGVGPRRTQPLYGGAGARAPYHWEGDLEDFPALVEAVHVQRMGGARLAQGRAERFRAWLASIPTPDFRSEAAPGAVRAGEDVFLDLGCDACHLGDRFTDGAIHDVGTGGRFQTPSLRALHLRGRLMHDGCAGDIGGRFDPSGRCGGDLRHGPFTPGAEEPPTAAEVRDLIAFLSSL